MGTRKKKLHTDKTITKLLNNIVFGGNEGDKILSSFNGILHNRRMRKKLNWLVKLARFCVVFLEAFEQDIRPVITRNEVSKSIRYPKPVI